MAKKKQKQKKKQATPMRMRRRNTQRQEMSAFGPLFVVGLIILGAINLQAAGLAFIGLTPTIVLAMTGKGAYKSERLQCVGFMNVAGVIPFAAQVMSGSYGVMYFLTDPISMATMFLSATVGYALVYVGPMMAAIVLQSLSQERIKSINNQRQALIELWGSEILGDKDGPEEEPSWAKGGRRP